MDIQYIYNYFSTHTLTKKKGASVLLGVFLSGLSRLSTHSGGDSRSLRTLDSNWMLNSHENLGAPNATISTKDFILKGLVIHLSMILLKKGPYY